jgi:hypothetical protein
MGELYTPLMFKFGKQKPDIKQYAIIGIVLSSIIAALSQCTGVSENGLWDLLDEIQKKYFPQTILNEFILKDPEKLNRRITRDVDKAIDDYWKQTGLSPAQVDKPKYIDEKNDESLCYTKECKALSPPMRIVAPWVDIKN